MYLQYYDDFSPSNVIIFKILDNFGQKVTKIEKIPIFYLSWNFFEDLTEWARKLKFGQDMQNMIAKKFSVPNSWFF